MDRGAWYLVGPLMGMVIVGLLWATNRPLGALGGYIDLQAWARKPADRLGWRAFFLGGVVLGGLVASLVAGGPHPTFAYDLHGVTGLVPQAALLVTAGVLMGYGARTAGGCTSGHGLFHGDGNCRRARARLVDRRCLVKTRLIAMPFGVAFGFLLVWGHLTDPEAIRSMLLLREADVFLLMGSAMMVAGLGAHALRAAGVRSLFGTEPISWTRTRPTRDHVLRGSINRLNVRSKVAVGA